MVLLGAIRVVTMGTMGVIRMETIMSINIVSIGVVSTRTINVS